MTVKVVRGNPTAEELAAALVVLHARAASAAVTVGPAPDALDVWAARSRMTATPWTGRDAWRTTYWPR
jgi:hypothetical protein